jgi:predicted RNA binding protein YcfA (HicA-like mRNA interferase family)
MYSWQDDFPAFYFVRRSDSPGQGIGVYSCPLKGSHIRFVHADGRKTTIPAHGGKDVPKGLLNKIVRHDLGIDEADFWEDS